MPILSRISLCDGLSKGSSLWQSLRASWSTAPQRTTSHSGKPYPDWTGNPGCHGNPSEYHIPTIWYLCKDPMVSGSSEMLNNLFHYRQNICWDGTVNKLYKNTPKAFITLRTVWACCSYSLHTIPLVLYFSLLLIFPFQHISHWGGWQLLEQLGWPGELLQSSESFVAFVSFAQVFFLFLSFF